MAGLLADLRGMADGPQPARLMSALVTLFEYPSEEPTDAAAALKAAVFTALHDESPERGLEFAPRLALRSTHATAFEAIVETLGSGSRDVLVTPSAAALANDIQTFAELVGACRTSPNEAIRQAASAFALQAAEFFVDQANAFRPVGQQAQTIPRLAQIRKLIARGPRSASNPNRPTTVVEHAAWLLEGFCSQSCFPPEIRRAVHALGLQFTWSIEDDVDRTTRAALFARCAAKLPEADQRDVLKNCLGLARGLRDEDATRLLKVCVESIAGLSTTVGGKAAIDVIAAARDLGDADVFERVVYALHRDLLDGKYRPGGLGYLSDVPENDRIDFWAELAEAAFHMPGLSSESAAELGSFMSGAVPSRSHSGVATAMRLAAAGTDLDFRTVAADWKLP